MNVYGELSGKLTGSAKLSGKLAGSARLSGTLAAPAKLSGTLTGPAKLTGTLTGYARRISGKLTVPSHSGSEIYDGAYEVTPSQETQTLQTDGLLMSGNVVIDPIPSNYGLITWNGVALTVS